MRPSDENQPASKRPNLMSVPRRTSGEIHILAMLDGHAGRPLSRRVLGLPMTWWYGGAGLLACLLVGTLAWLAGTGGKPRPAPVPAAVAVAAPEPAGPAEEEAVPPALDQPAALAVLDATAPEAEPPPLSETAPPAPVVAPVPAASAPAARPAFRPATRPAPRTAARAEAHAPRPRRAPAAARPRAPTPGVDTDVALISAIIKHGGKPPEARPNCADGPCTYPLPER